MQTRTTSTPALFAKTMLSKRGSSLVELLAKQEQLSPIVDGQHTGTGDTTENVGSGTLEERADTFLGNDLRTRVER